MDQTERTLNLLDNLEVRLTAVFQAAVPSIPQSDPLSFTSSPKNKRNQKTRRQYKKKAQAQARDVATVHVQEVDHI